LTTIALGLELGPGVTKGMAERWVAARGSSMPIQVHSGMQTRPEALSGAADQGLLGPDVTLVHGPGLDGTTIDAVAGSGASVSLAPASEMAGGLGSPPIQQLVDRRVRPGLGVDDERIAPGDMFAQMRATISFQHATVFDRKLAGKAGLPRLMSTRDVIRFATVDGARVAGLGRVTGSLEPGKQADIVVLRTDRPNVYPINDPIGAVVWGMDTSNVDWVLAAGRVLMRGGRLEADADRARANATSAGQRVAGATGLVVGAASGGDG
jgi:5-methylthioadenosine/S-adenosylhomocysteine deaminase